MTDDEHLSLFELFQEEARAHAASLSHGLLALENDSANHERLEPLMRAAHSLKGAARIIGLDAAVALAHAMEDAFVAAQAGKIKIGAADIDQLLAGTDLLASLAQVNQQTAGEWGRENASRIEALVAAIEGRLERRPAIKGERASPPGGAAGADVAAQTLSGSDAMSTPRFKARPPLPIPDQPISSSGETPLFDLFREEIRSNATAIQSCLLKDQAGDWTSEGLETLLAAVHAIGGAALLLEAHPIAEWVRAVKEALGALPATATVLGSDVASSLWSALEPLVELIGMQQEDLPTWIANREATFAQFVRQLRNGPAHATVGSADAAGGPADAAAAPALSPTQAPESAPPDLPPSTVAAASPDGASAASGSAAGVVRVSAQSLNRLMGLAGESLVQARWLPPFSTALVGLKQQQDRAARLIDELAQAVIEGSDRRQAERLVAQVRRQVAVCRQALLERTSEFDDHTSLAEDLNARLYREALMSRMRPFADGTHGFGRLVRDMARRLGKQVALDLVGVKTEVDRDVLEKLEAPLTHLLRNAVDHGIESPPERRAAGKPALAKISLSVEHRAGMLIIAVADDGRGVDLATLRGKIIARGLTTAELARGMSAAELLEFLFLPGFSTAADVTEFSGRGVGLDVVQQTVRGIGGSVRITSQAGAGTVFHLQLPITLSVIRAVLVDIAGEPYALPHNRIERLVRLPRTALLSLEGRQYAAIDGQNVGVVLGSEILGHNRPSPDGDELSLVVLCDGGVQYGVIVDAIGGEQDLVVRPLDPRLGKTPNIAAAAILNDGTPTLIVDVEDLIRSVDRRVQQGVLQRCAPQSAGERPAKRILVIDDSITVREVVRQILRGQGYAVTVAVDGQEGWNLVRGNPFDLVVTDVDMPRMNGLELVRLIRSEPALRQMPVMIVSYKERASDRLLGLEVGANFYLTKSSFHDNTFLQAVKDLIGDA